MKKLLLTFTAVVGLVCMSSAQVSYGLKAGVNLAKMLGSADGESETSDALTTFNVTAFIDTYIGPNVSFQPGLSLQGKGGGGVNFDEEGGSKGVMSFMYLEVPLNFLYHVPAGSGELFIGAGPFAAYAVSGRIKQGGVSVDIFGEELDAALGSFINRFDAGANFLAGYKMSNGVLINAGYGLGLLNMVKESNGSIKNRVFSFGLGFQF